LLTNKINSLFMKANIVTNFLLKVFLTRMDDIHDGKQ